MVGEYYKHKGLFFSEGMERNGIQAGGGFVSPGHPRCPRTCYSWAFSMHLPPPPLPRASVRQHTYDRSSACRSSLLLFVLCCAALLYRTRNLETSAVLLFSFIYMGLSESLVREQQAGESRDVGSVRLCTRPVKPNASNVKSFRSSFDR